MGEDLGSGFQFVTVKKARQRERLSLWWELGTETTWQLAQVLLGQEAKYSGQATTRRGYDHQRPISRTSLLPGGGLAS